MASASGTPNAAAISVVSSGFDGNLAVADNTVQKAAQKLDDLVIPVGVSLQSYADQDAAEAATVGANVIQYWTS